MEVKQCQNLAKKIGMTQIFEDGKLSCTVVEAGPNYVLQKKTVEMIYSSTIGFDEKRKN